MGGQDRDRTFRAKGLEGAHVSRLLLQGMLTSIKGTEAWCLGPAVD